MVLIIKMCVIATGLNSNVHVHTNCRDRTSHGSASAMLMQYTKTIWTKFFLFKLRTLARCMSRPRSLKFNICKSSVNLSFSSWVNHDEPTEH